MTTLFDLLADPAPFHRTAPTFWDEPHIAEHLLRAHLDADADGASRSHRFIDRSVEWMARLVPSSAHPDLLDLGCGPGLYAERLHDHGYTVTGIDFSRRSIDYARRRAGETGRSIRYRHGDYLRLEDEAAFDAAIMIYCDYGALSPAEGASLLRRVHRCLRPGGKLLLDVFTPVKYAAFRERREWARHREGGFWCADPHVAIHADLRYDAQTTLERTVVVSRTGTHDYAIWQRYFTPETIARELESAGFRTCGVFGDVAGDGYTPHSETVAVLAERP